MIQEYKHISGVQKAENTFFISGGNTNLIEELKLSLSKVFVFKCIGNYCQPESDKPSDFGLRKNIVEFFGFKERLKPSQKNDKIIDTAK